MDPNEFLSSSPEEQAKTLASMRGLVAALEGRQVDANDERVVWFQNRRGIRDVCVYRHWRTYLSRHPELGVRLLDPHECAEEEQKVAQAAVERSERRRLWARVPFKRRAEYGGGPDALPLADLRELAGRVETAEPPVDQLAALQATIRELQAQIAQAAPAPRNRVRGRPRGAVAATIAAE